MRQTHTAPRDRLPPPLAQADISPLDGPDGLIGQLTAQIIERALSAGMDDHLGYEKSAPKGRGQGIPGTAITERPEPPRTGPALGAAGRNSEFESQIARKRQPRAGTRSLFNSRRLPPTQRRPGAHRLRGGEVVQDGRGSGRADRVASALCRVRSVSGLRKPPTALTAMCGELRHASAGWRPWERSRCLPTISAGIFLLRQRCRDSIP